MLSSMLSHDFPKREHILAENVFVGRMMRGSRERWIKNYSSGYSILLVGDGDFSFSLCLAMAFGSGTNIIATTLDTYDELIGKYKNAKENIAFLVSLGATIMHGVDATQMKNLPFLASKKFHRIIYNFPHAGFYGKEDNLDMIMMHRDLVRGFLSNARSMLRVDGEIHINHKTTAPFNRWDIENLGVECWLLCAGQDDFKIEDYPGYCNKRGAGSRADEPFPLGACSTFKFKLFPGVFHDNPIQRRKVDMISTPLFNPYVVNASSPEIIPIPRVSLKFYDVNASQSSPQMISTSAVNPLTVYGSTRESLRKYGDCVRSATSDIYKESIMSRVGYVNASQSSHQMIPTSAVYPSTVYDSIRESLRKYGSHMRIATSDIYEESIMSRVGYVNASQSSPQMIPTSAVNPSNAYVSIRENLRKCGDRVRSATSDVYEDSIRSRVRYVNGGSSRRTPSRFGVTRYSPYGRL